MRIKGRESTLPYSLIWWGHRGRWVISISCYLATACWSIAFVSLTYCPYTTQTQGPVITFSFQRICVYRPIKNPTPTTGVFIIRQASRSPASSTAHTKGITGTALSFSFSLKTQLALFITATSISGLTARAQTVPSTVVLCTASTRAKVHNVTLIIKNVFFPPPIC